VLYELDGVPEDGTLVHAGDEPLDDLPSAEIEPTDASNGLRMQEPPRIIGGGCLSHGEALSCLRIVS